MDREQAYSSCVRCVIDDKPRLLSTFSVRFGRIELPLRVELRRSMSGRPLGEASARGELRERLTE